MNTNAKFRSNDKDGNPTSRNLFTGSSPISVSDNLNRPDKSDRDAYDLGARSYAAREVEDIFRSNGIKQGDNLAESMMKPGVYGAASLMFIAGAINGGRLQEYESLINSTGKMIRDEFTPLDLSNISLHHDDIRPYSFPMWFDPGEFVTTTALRSIEQAVPSLDLSGDAEIAWGTYQSMSFAQRKRFIAMRTVDPDLLVRMDLLRQAYGKPIRITGGVRTLSMVESLKRQGRKAVTNGAHVISLLNIFDSKADNIKLCKAADFQPVGLFSSAERYRLELYAARLFHRIGSYKTFIHVDRDPRLPSHVKW